MKETEKGKKDIEDYEMEREKARKRERGACRRSEPSERQERLHETRPGARRTLQLERVP